MSHLPAALVGLPLFRRTDALRAGAGDLHLQRAVAAGEVVRVGRGWYAPPPPGGPSRQTDEYRLRALAAARARSLPMTALSAAVDHGLPVWDLADAPVYLCGRSTGRHASSVVLMGPVTAAAQQSAGRVVPVLEALVTTALVDPAMGLAAADAALHRSLVDRADVMSSLTALDGRRGAVGARSALRLADGRRESPGESRVALLCHAWGIPLVPQVVVDTQLGTYRVDFEVAGTGVVLELDGMVTYADRADLYREKRREDAIRATGRIVVRIVWADLADPMALRRRILAAVSSS